jgi:hypothetical protein
VVLFLVTYTSEGAFPAALVIVSGLSPCHCLLALCRLLLLLLLLLLGVTLSACSKFVRL